MILIILPVIMQSNYKSQLHTIILQSLTYMSYPDYLNKIINSTNKNRQIQTVRNEITKLISTQRDKKDSILSLQKQQLRIEDASKTTVNFFRSDAYRMLKQIPYEPRKTFSEMHISRLKSKIEQQQQKRAQKVVVQPQPQAMSEWREEMLKHLKPKEVSPTFQIQQEQKQAQVDKRNVKDPRIIRKIFLTEKYQQNLEKRLMTTSPPAKKSEKLYREGKIQSLQTNRASSHKNIILIRPQPVSEQQMKQKNIQKLNRLNLNPKKSLKKKEFLLQNDIVQQRLANFSALLPYLGMQKAKVQKRSQKQKQPKIAQQEHIPPKKSESKKQKKKKDHHFIQEIVEITGWETRQI